jgi:hypothetical protein
MDNILIEWIEDIELQVVTSIENDDVESNVEVVKKGEVDDVCVLEDRKDVVDIQFGDGSVSFNVQKTWYKKVK